jgi:hypothetical protein
LIKSRTTRQILRIQKKSALPSDAEVTFLLQANAQDTSWKMELAHRIAQNGGTKKKGLSTLRTSQALVITIHDPDVYEAYQE